jgi:Coenzyme PQQ synthesis protein D (PqqD)
MATTEHSSALDLPVRRADVEWVKLDREAVLYDPRAHMLHRLNAGAAAVWAACDGTASAGQITRSIQDTHSGSRGVIERDVTAVIERLRRLDLLWPSPVERDAGR